MVTKFAIFERKGDYQLYHKTMNMGTMYYGRYKETILRTRNSIKAFQPHDNQKTTVGASL